jgi:hypothetical protein
LRAAKNNPVNYHLVGHIIRTSCYPIPWLLGDFDHVGYYEHDDLPSKVDADFLLVQQDRIAEVEAKLQGSYFTEPLTLRAYQDPSKFYLNARTFRKLFPGQSLYHIPHNLYFDLRDGRFTPNVYQLIALSCVSGYSLIHWLSVFGFHLDDIPRLQLRLSFPQTMLLDSDVYDRHALDLRRELMTRSDNTTPWRRKHDGDNTAVQPAPTLRYYPTTLEELLQVVSDVEAVLRDAFRHRLVLSYQALAEEVTADHILDEVLAAVPAPQIDFGRTAPAAA